MASATTSTQRPRLRKRHLSQIIDEACETDNVAILADALTPVDSKTKYTPAEVDEKLPGALNTAIRDNASNVVSYLLSHGANVGMVRPGSISSGGFSLPMMEGLLERGWDINTRDTRTRDTGKWRGFGDEKPLLWLAVSSKPELVQWCLDHGAIAVLKDQGPPILDSGDANMDYWYACPPILEFAAQRGTVALFERLRSLGAPLGPRTLHRAVAECILSDDQQSETDLQRFEQRKHMVRHLVGMVGLDVNQRDQPEGWRLGNFIGTPLDYVDYRTANNRDCTWVLSFLLDHGADVKSAELIAEKEGNSRFAASLKQWNETRSQSES